MRVGGENGVGGRQNRSACVMNDPAVHFARRALNIHPNEPSANMSRSDYSRPLNNSKSYATMILR